MDFPETHYAMSGDVHVAHQVTGTGPVDLVWAPGTASHLDLDWEFTPKARVIRQFGQFSRVVRFDKRRRCVNAKHSVSVQQVSLRWGGGARRWVDVGADVLR